MKIGIDAKHYFHGPPSGVVVVRNLVDTLLKMNVKNEIVLFLNKNDKNAASHFSSYSFVTIKYIWAPNSFIAGCFSLPMAAQNMELDVVIFQHFTALWGKFKKITFIYDVLFLSNPEYFTYIERLYFSLVKPSSKMSDLVCTISVQEKERMIRHGFNKNPTVVYLGVSEMYKPKEQCDGKKLLAVSEKFNLPEQFLLFVGRLNIRKNIIAVIRALSLMRSELPLVIVGGQEGEIKKIDFTAMIAKLGLTSRVIFTGNISEAELTCIYSLATIFCYPSFAEGFGLPALEAMASGIPVVVSDLPSLKEVCGYAALYVDPHRPEDIAHAVDNLVNDRQLYQQKKLEGLENAAKFSWEKTSLQLLEHCRSLLEPPRT